MLAKVSKNRLKYLAGLKLKKHRSEEGVFVVEGEKLVAEALNQQAVEVISVIGLEGWWIENRLKYKGLDSNFELVGEADLRRISSFAEPNQVLAICRQPDWALDETILAQDVSLYLDDITDPGNAGTILRIADWFGIRHVFVSPGSVEVFNPKVVQASMGAIFRVRVLAWDFGAFREKFPQVAVVTSELKGENIFKVHLPKGLLLVIGNESKGISAAILDSDSLRVSIPSAPGGGAESLNAAVAAGIICACIRNN
jgi:TrmH family RNA methyltransferase